MDNVWADDEFVNNLDNQLKSHSFDSHDEMYEYGRINLVDAMLSIKKDNIVLDMGCGSGSTLQRHHNAHYLVGIDISNKFCRDAKKMFIMERFCWLRWIISLLKKKPLIGLLLYILLYTHHIKKKHLSKYQEF
jgi:ubiquinone/menaquinone biosynthesis C-methylase UbiE